MKNRRAVCLAVMVVMSVITVAQDMKSQEQNPSAPGTSAKAVTISGKVSDDRSALVSGNDTGWAVSNPDALKGREGRQVTVKCLTNPDLHTIRVLSVKKGPSEMKYTANKGDSAFRR
jgi:hypothetical protein